MASNDTSSDDSSQNSDASQNGDENPPPQEPAQDDHPDQPIWQLKNASMKIIGRGKGGSIYFI